MQTCIALIQEPWILSSIARRVLTQWQWGGCGWRGEEGVSNYAEVSTFGGEGVSNYAEVSTFGGEKVSNYTEVSTFQGQEYKITLIQHFWVVWWGGISDYSSCGISDNTTSTLLEGISEYSIMTHLSSIFERQDDVIKICRFVQVFTSLTFLDTILCRYF